ncbi:SAM-dependent methyltransferase [Pleurostoma richardsiae]|uniref:SAM-dependent methyltransferase n=1 Tax=Pleurostoma richardsiae TaxID=41990 RepID=A0AA38R7I2_9PEZI|nr:SAM-dependent methyltransferase [Pleurostoma richardsiae]
MASSEASSARLPLEAASNIAGYSLHDPHRPEVEISQVEHRIRLINLWDIGTGARVLEIGCGQGTCTAVLAEAVGANGHVDAVDPGPPDYGAPYTLAQAQAHLSASRVGSRIAWHRAQPVEFLNSTMKSETWDVAVLAHCVWYFSSSDVLRDILESLQDRVKRVCIAEYALHATETAATAHVLAALARGTLETHKTQSHQNIQTPLSPGGIKRIAADIGWSVQGESSVVPEPGLLDGYWEVGMVASARFEEEIAAGVSDERVRTLLRSAREATIAAADAAGGAKKVRTMDVWAATLI